MKRIALVLMVASLLALGGSAFAELCTIDNVPAATLLLPYFEVDLDDVNGVDTLFSVNNASAAPTIAHVVLWTNWSAPTIDFDIFLTGYDVSTVRMRDVFNGVLPVTADEQTDPADTISPHGGDFADNPQWDGSFPNCGAIFPYPTPVVSGTALDRLLNGHTGQPVASLGGACLGADLGDNVARGYITIDNASECSLILDPGDPTYFIDGGTGIANNINQLWGDYFLVDPSNNFAQGDNLVHIEAADDFNAGSTPTAYTFYGRYTQALNGSDNREPLGSTWGVRYLNGGAFTGGTDLVVWRDSTADNLLPAGAACGNTVGAGPDWFPLNETEVVAFNEEEDAVEICFFTGGIISPPDENDPACFPYETGRYEFGTAPLSVPFDFGWTFINLNLPADAPTGDVDFPPVGGNIAQSYVTAIHSASGLFSVGLQAIELTSACEDLNPLLTTGNDIPPFNSNI
ncbi:MAG: hypothetical protein AAGN46_00760 [Acidobacteriota bacterium]